MDNIPALQPQPIEHADGGITPTPKKPRKKTLLQVLIASLVVVIAMVVTLGVLYVQALKPVNSQDIAEVSVEIVSGSTPSQIGETLKAADVIRSEFVFAVYTRLHGVQNKLQAGTYQLKKSQSLADIVTSLVKGPSADEFEVTFLPGATLAQNKKELLRVGYSQAEVDAAVTAQYDHPLFQGRPASADLEGYLYGETHRFMKGASIETVLTRYFDDFYTVVKENNLVEKYKKQGLSLYQGITLASVIQRESGGDDEAQIAQVFLLRLKRGIQLGSDVTYQYIADKLGVPRDVNLDNPYNTRRYTGLPPGPIATPGKKALLAVGSPAAGDYLYFLSGDDDKTYFGRTEAEHQKNISDHCHQKCQIL